MANEPAPVNFCVVNAFGRDVVGLVGLLASMVAEAGGNIVDIVEHVTHGYFSILMVVDLRRATLSYPRFVSRLETTAGQTGLHLVIEQAGPPPAARGGARLLLLVILGPDRPGIVAKLAFTLGNCGINIEQLRMIARGDLFAMEVLADAGGCARPLAEVQAEIAARMGELGMSAVFQTENVYTRAKRLIVFEADAPAFAQSVRAAAGRALPDRDEAAAPAAIPAALLAALAAECRAEAGSVELVRVLHAMGYRVALVSAGLEPFVGALQAQLGADHARGGVRDAARRRELVAELARGEGLTPAETVVIGDAAPGRPRAGVGFRYAGARLGAALATGELTAPQAAAIAAQFALPA